MSEGTETKIIIAENQVFFDGKITPIKDSASMSYMFLNNANRELSLRLVNPMQEDPEDQKVWVPTWHFMVVSPRSMIVCDVQFTGYGTFHYACGRLVRMRDSGICEIMQKKAA